MKNSSTCSRNRTNRRTCTAVFFTLLFLLQFGVINPAVSGEPLFRLAVQKHADATFEQGDILPVTVNEELLEQPVSEGQLLEIPFPSDEMKTYRITGVSEFIEGRISVRAVQVDDPYEQLTFSYGDGRLLGKIDRFTEGRSWRIAPAGETWRKTVPGSAESGHILEYRDPEELDILECGVGTELVNDKSHQQHFHDPESRSHIHSPFDLATSSPDAGIPVDLMIVYTESAKNWADEHRGGMEHALAEMMNLSQQALDNSELNIELRVVHTHQTDFDEQDDGGSTILRKLTASPELDLGSSYQGYMQEVHDLRDQHGADLVAMVADISDVGGVAWMLSHKSGNPQRGFSVNRVRQIDHTYVLIHEVGHNMGKAHSRNQDDAAAGIFGGIFEYSTGWRFTGEADTSYATVMTYEEGISTRIPYFSSPDIEFRGVPTGSYEGEDAPADNVRSLQYTRNIVANYRLTEIRPPYIEVHDQNIAAESEPNRETEVRITIENSGNSTLHWTTDVGYPDDSPLAKQIVPEHAGKPAATLQIPGRPAGYATYPYTTHDGQRLITHENQHHYSSKPLNTTAASTSLNRNPSSKSTADNTRLNPNITSTNLPSSPVLFQTGFSADEEYTTGKHVLHNGWTSRPRNEDNLFEISSENPSTGSQHLRLKPVGDLNEGYTGVYLPFLGPLTSQGYSISMDLKFSQKETENEFHIIVDQSSSAQNTAWVWFENGNIIIRDRDDEDNPDFLFSGASWEAGEYFNFEIRVDPRRDRIQYLLDGQFIFTGNLFGGSAPEQILLAHLNRQTDDVYDIDNLKVQTLDDPEFPRFQMRKTSGAIAPDNEQEIPFRIIADDIPEGDYEFDLVIHTNDFSQQQVTIPVQYQVTPPTSTEEPGRIASEFALYQNYPNPFNPTTSIVYSLAENSDVQLDVMTVDGRHVTTLVDEHQPAGRHNVRFDAGGLASGIYLYRLKAGSFTQTGRMTLVK